MRCSKRLFLTVGLLAIAILSFGPSSADADWITPTDIWDHSPDAQPTANMIDSNQGTYNKMYDDSESGPCTGYVILDLGSVQTVNGFKFWPRIHDTASTGPENLDFFYFENEALMPEGYDPNTTATLALDSNVIIAASRTLPAIHGTDPYETAFTSGETFVARYVGLWTRSSYDGEGTDARNQYAEVQFDVSPVPEPSALVLLGAGLMGLLCYAWRKRK